LRKPWICLECRILMEMVDDDHCICPACRTEVWFEFAGPDLSDDDPPINRNSAYVSRSLPEGYRVPPGGSKAGKRPDKKGTKTYLDNGFEG